jgi:Na+-translocating ferredoxin:NAD+ oxidoreductase RnfG subunit
MSSRRVERAALPLAPLVVAATLPTSAFAVDYLSVEQAQKVLFPQAERFESRALSLTAEQLQAVEARHGVKARTARWRVWQASAGGKPLGWVVVDDVVGKFELITYAVAVGADGAVQQVEILSYRESHGAEVRLPAWRKQFVGKTASAPLQVGQDINNISGATLSCSHVTEGVKRIVAVLDVARQQGWLGAP